MSFGVDLFKSAPSSNIGDKGACFMANAEPNEIKKKPLFGGEGVHLTPQQQSQSIFC